MLTVLPLILETKAPLLGFGIPGECVEKRPIGILKPELDRVLAAHSEKLSGRDQYRLRQGNDRIVYEVQDLDLVVVARSFIGFFTR